MESRFNLNSYGPDFIKIAIVFFLVFYLFSGVLSYITCLLIPGYFTYRCIKEKAHENVQKSLLKYWICYGLLSYPLKLISNFIFFNEMINNLIQILVFANLYHSKSQLSENIINFIEKILGKFENDIKMISKGFFEGFNEGLSQKQAK